MPFLCLIFAALKCDSFSGVARSFNFMESVGTGWQPPVAASHAARAQGIARFSSALGTHGFASAGAWVKLVGAAISTRLAGNFCANKKC